MTEQLFIDKVFALAKAEGFDAWELFFETGSSLELQSFEKEIIKYSDSTTRGVNFRGTIGGNPGSCFSEILDEEAIVMLVTRAKEAALLIESDDEVIIYEGGKPYKELNLYSDSLKSIDNTRKLDLVLAEEANAMDTCKIDKVSGSYYGDGETSCRLVNSKGLDITYKRNQAYSYIGVIASDENDKYSAYEFKVDNDFEALVNANNGEKAVEKAVEKMGATQVGTGEYQVVFSNEASSSLLGVYLSAFSAEAAQKGMSLLKGKIGETIASPLITLIDDPHMEGGLSSTPFDGEGVPTFTKSLIEEGVLNTLLHNLKTAKKDGVETTGNASRGSFKSTIGVSSTNAFIKPTDMTKEALLEQVGNGLFITELDGLHAGTNAISGDFSLGARGFVIEGGKLGHPVKQIVLSGNYFTMLKDVTAVANDLQFKTEPVGSPAILVNKLSVAGK
ncbi:MULTISPECIES: TldD/PmbA family protein [unclassified Fusibacter]|uniref:TldD/PmbA family protein n=1 Tax=unclassified Fusibacter TaxID=2624464 RepID=UPI001012528F|nr:MULTISPECIES: metallopeptidase TldD-related protein [unclassified Fusibacter]MCK8058651.1 TldD/PmbA family protein [Fusibacter sp. A2]NPE21726.1 TldD/PmbA family protein [Fusibacter sp. A1]RXV61300.1 TldD/PmbA family protein [Fusibacter sp. A1]